MQLYYGILLQSPLLYSLAQLTISAITLYSPPNLYTGNFFLNVLELFKLEDLCHLVLLDVRPLLQQEWDLNPSARWKSLQKPLCSHIEKAAMVTQKK